MRILIVNGNPDPAAERLTGGLAQAYADGASGAGHEVRRIDVGALSFSLLRNAADFVLAPKDGDIVAAQASFRWAEHLVFIYPIWFGTIPALFKAFMELVGCGEFLATTRAGGYSKGNLNGRSARVIVTMGMPALLYRLVFGAHGAKSFKRSILQLSGFSPVRMTYLGDTRNSYERCRAWIALARRLGKDAL
jgi:putative NADPH-quinone reductase